jgi:hypothetical protein
MKNIFFLSEFTKSFLKINEAEENKISQAFAQEIFFD